MKTTIYVPDDVMKALKTKAQIERKSQSEVIREALETATAAYLRPPKPRFPLGHRGSLPADASEHINDFLTEGFGRD